MGCAQRNEHVDRVEARVLGKRPRDDLEGVCKCFDGELGAAADGCSVFAEPEREFDLGRTAAGDEFLIFDGHADDPEGILDGTVEFGDDMLGAAADDDRDSLRVLAPGHEGHLLAGDLLLLDSACLTELLGGDGVDGADDCAAGRTGEFLHVALLDAPDGKDPGLCKVVLGDVVDTLLAEENVCTARDDLVDDALDHPLLFVEEHLELVGARDADLGVDLGLLELDGGVQEQDLRVLDDAGHRGVDALLIDDHALDDLGLLDGSADLLLDLDELGVDGAVGIGNHRDRPDDEVGDLLFGGFGALAGHRSIGKLLEHRHIVGFDVDGNLVEDNLRSVCGHPVAVGDDRGVHILIEEILGALQELACDHHGGRGAVADLVVLGLCDLDHHLRGGVLDVHLF
ncbi:MAG: hypothetical protein BWX50_01208 [Euryarchaeota archaeon ADurb.Bin009]|nr:MAG: hypothetical protein BWX50_01208 [Euryarchaeota archaeon ADurb.Bin009]